MTIIDDVTSGKTSPEEAIRSLALDLGETESELSLVAGALQQQVKDLRDQIAIVLSVSNRDKVQVSGFGTVLMTKPSLSYSYDKKKLDKLCMVLRQMGNIDLADDVEACRDIVERAGSLRITREK